MNILLCENLNYKKLSYSFDTVSKDDGLSNTILYNTNITL